MSTVAASTTVCLTSACVSNSLQLGVTTVTAPAKCSEIGTNTLSCVTTPPAPTSTGYLSCSYYYADPDKAVNSAYCVCSGSTFSPTVGTAAGGSITSCAYTSLPTNTIAGGSTTNTYTITTDIGSCQVCTQVSMLPTS